MNETELTVAGRVVADPEHRTTRTGLQFTIFRLASTVRRRSREGVYVDGPTSFYNVAAYRALGMNSHTSLRKGDPVIVHGRLTISSWQRADESWGSSADIEALSVGHDLTFGTTEYAKVARGAVDAASQEAGQGGYARMAERIATGDGPSWATATPTSTDEEEAAAGRETAGGEESEPVRLSA